MQLSHIPAESNTNRSGYCTEMSRGWLLSWTLREERGLTVCVWERGVWIKQQETEGRPM